MMPSSANGAPPPQAPPHNYAISAALFSSALIQRLENDPNIRLPGTYIGVRRVRPTGGKSTRARNNAQCTQKPLWKNGGEDDLWEPNIISRNCSKEAVGCVDGEGDCDGNKGVLNKSNGDSSESRDEKSINTSEIVYKVTNPDGTQRRMTKQEKKQLKYELQQAKKSTRREERQQQHEQRIKEAKKEKWERKRQKKMAWKKKKQMQQQGENGDVEQSGPGDDDEREAQNPPHVQQTSSELSPAKADEAHDNQSDVVESKTEGKSQNEINDDQQSNALYFGGEKEFDEELAALRGERRGIPPVMLTPAATAVACEIGALQSNYMNRRKEPHDNESADAKSGNIVGIAPYVSKQNIITTFDRDLSKQWAEQLQQSMAPVEEVRSKENMRPMAYRLVPEAWTRLCPKSLCDKEGVNEENIELKNQNPKESEVQDNDQALESQFVPPKSAQIQLDFSPDISFLRLREPSPCYDRDSYFIFRHLQQNSHLHIACGAIFGCDFVLYDGRRDDRHSFAGVRVYSCHASSKNRINPSSNPENKTDGPYIAQNHFPIPSTYDMTGFVRAMNTARKIALIATVVHEPTSPSTNNVTKENGCGEYESVSEDDDKGSSVAKILIVDLALEKVLEAPTHVKKGNTTKRRSEEDTVASLAKQRRKD